MQYIMEKDIDFICVNDKKTSVYNSYNNLSINLIHKYKYMPFSLANDFRGKDT